MVITYLDSRVYYKSDVEKRKKKKREEKEREKFKWFFFFLLWQSSLAHKFSALAESLLAIHTQP